LQFNEEPPLYFHKSSRFYILLSSTLGLQILDISPVLISFKIFKYLILE
jgi:hypothetical protein